MARSSITSQPEDWQDRSTFSSDGANVEPACDEGERARRRELAALGVLDTPAEERFDRYTRLVADVMGVPVCLVSFIDRGRERIKSAVGTAFHEVDRRFAPGDRVLSTSDVVEIADLSGDPALFATPFLRQATPRRFYAGVRLRGPHGIPVGTLAILGEEPRRLSEAERRRLVAFADLVESELSAELGTSYAPGGIDATLFRDPLTRLPGPLLPEDYADEWIAELAPSESLVAAHVHIRNLEAINSAYGRVVGDELVRLVARRAYEAAPASSIVTRLSGARLVLLIRVNGGRDHAEAPLAAVVRSMGQPTDIAPDVVTPDVEVGVAVSPSDAREGHDLTEKARQAAQGSQQAVADRPFRFYSPGTEPTTDPMQRIPFRLADAVEEGAVAIRFQPIYDLKNDRLTAMEALVRWDDTALGELTPGTFIPLIEADPRLARMLTRHVLKQACAQLVAMGPDAPAVSVNVAATDLYQPDFGEFVLGIVDAAGVSRHKVILELTEQSLIEDAERAVRTLSWLSEQGIRLALDDFGTGYSSLNYLRRLPVHVLKIDRSFVNDVDAGSTGDSVAAGIVTIGRSLGLRVVAEGIETNKDLVRAKALGCELGQGYLLGCPTNGESLVGDAVAEGGSSTV